MKAAALLFVFAMLALTGCTSLARIGGATCEIRGIVRDSDDRSPVANLPVRVTGAHVELKAILMLWPISTFTPLTHVMTDAQGKFSCVVPLYAGYRFYAGDMARTKWGGRIVERKDITRDTEVELLVVAPLFAPKEPNKAPEPTTLAVTPRALVLSMSNASFASARVAPARFVAHL